MELPVASPLTSKTALVAVQESMESKVEARAAMVSSMGMAMRTAAFKAIKGIICTISLYFF